MMTRSRTATQRAFTLIELMVVLAIAAVLATMVLPLMRNDDRIKLIAIASLVQSDIEFAQALSISEPSNKALVKFDPDNDEYHLARWGDESTPIVREDTGEQYVVRFGQGRASSAANVTMTLTNMGSGALEFDSHGGLRDFALTPVITLQAGNDWIQLTVEPTTGTIKESSGSGTPP